MRNLSYYERYKILKRPAELLEKNIDEYTKIISLEGIKTVNEARVEVKRMGDFVYPAVLENPSENTKAVTQEVFGPVVSVFPINALEEGIREANDTEFSLHAAIFMQKIDKALYTSRELRFGGVMVNDSTDFLLDYMPFSEFKKPGIEREGFNFAI